jgi:hypothetical protein
MEQHPVPQHITAYQFRLVGDMTLKQFGFLAGGCAVALLFYAAPLANYFKWPLVLFSGFFGFAFAFMPIEERPLDRWFLAFLKAVYSPTRFLWKKTVIIPEFFQVVPRPRVTKVAPVAPPDQERLTEYLKTLPTTPQTPLDQREASALNQITNLFQLTPLPATLFSTPKPSPQATEEEKPGIKIRKLRFLPTKPIKFEKTVEKPITRKPTQKIAPIKKKPWIAPMTVKPKMAPDLPIPTPPDRPNLLVGMVLDQENKLVENTIIEIRDEKGNPVRALKTNKLGQFRIATPLKNGTYEIEAEKEGLKFDIIKIILKGEIIQPIEIKAK